MTKARGDPGLNLSFGHPEVSARHRLRKKGPRMRFPTPRLVGRTAPSPCPTA